MNRSQFDDGPHSFGVESLSVYTKMAPDGTADFSPEPRSPAVAEDASISFLQKRLSPLAFGALYSAVLNITAIIGVGILTLPQALASLTWSAGVIFLVVSLAATYFSLWQLVQMHEEKVPKEDGRIEVVTYNRYQDLAYRAWGKKGMRLVAIMQLVVFVGVSITYMLTGGLSLMNVYELTRCYSSNKYCAPITQKPVVWIAVFSSAQYLLSQRRGFKALFYLSLVAAVMSLSYSGIIFGATLAVPHPSPPPPPHNGTKSMDVWNAFTALGTVAFAYAGHNVVLDIQSSIPTSASMPTSKSSMLWGISIAYLSVAVCYFAVAISGYAKFQDDVGANVLGTFALADTTKLSLANPKHHAGWVVAANLMVTVHLTGTYQVYAMPVYLQLEKVLPEKFTFFTQWSKSPVKYHRDSYRIVVRSAYIFFTFIMAILLPDFNSLLGILGGVAFAPTTYFIPGLIWRVLFRPKRWSCMWTMNWGMFVLGVIVMVLSFVGSLATFIIHLFIDVNYRRQYWTLNTFNDYN
eukprot:TRINITY_DN628_c0_g1_i1.p1 TRINITY_DN628_c0_g1~~TRINITY_DN628_c0_g1_i1.p1  ORF type:complete len:520 (-),score=43.81 TRINITY_DN628_c0_g1_i1:85-1644(-)